jgi:hypothetical protein
MQTIAQETKQTKKNRPPFMVITGSLNYPQAGAI